jgi:hypothetical protein
MWFMILPLILDNDFPVSELGDLVEVIFGMMCLLLLLRFVILVGLMTLITVRSCTVLICDAHIDVAGVFAGPAAIWGYTTGPAHTVAGG